MSADVDDVAFEAVDPRSDDACTAVQAYFDELDARFPGGFDPGDAPEADAGRFDPPAGTFVVARLDGRVVGCGGLRRFDDTTGEVKRMWVDRTVRGRRIGARLLAWLEDEARRRGYARMRLDTNSCLIEAIGMYQRAGYAPIERYNPDPHADRFFERSL